MYFQTVSSDNPCGHGSHWAITSSELADKLRTCHGSVHDIASPPFANTIGFAELLQQRGRESPLGNGHLHSSNSVGVNIGLPVPRPEYIARAFAKPKGLQQRPTPRPEHQCRNVCQTHWNPRRLSICNLQFELSLWQACRVRDVCCACARSFVRDMRLQEISWQRSVATMEPMALGAFPFGFCLEALWS